MKIPGSDGSDSKVKRLQDGVSGDQTVARKPGVRTGQGEDGPGRALGVLGGDDSVNVSSLGALLKSELDPAKLAAERREKLEALKQQIKDGTYQPPLENVAKSLSQELSFEILLSGDDVKDDSSELL
jgi:anti-sigma28 factor (negative regulator of flagellin synthesis)